LEEPSAPVLVLGWAAGFLLNELMSVQTVKTVTDRVSELRRFFVYQQKFQNFPRNGESSSFEEHFGLYDIAKDPPKPVIFQTAKILFNPCLQTLHLTSK